MKKSLPIIFAALVMVSALTGCVGRNSSPEQNNATVQSSETIISQPVASTIGASSPTISPNASAAYEKLIAYKTEGYEKQSIADFNEALASTPDELTEFLAAVADVGSTISHDDENYDFFNTTISFSSHELYCEHMGEEFTFHMPLSKQSRPCDYLDEDGETVYDFTCFVEADVAYSINAPKLVTVAERDKALLTLKEEMQNYLNGLSETEIASSDIKKMLKTKSAELANSLSTKNMKLSPCDIYMIEIHNAGTEITK
ncbi:hypothetical protein C823_005074 [Eubacterium plexicaudatum ASF492]|uniref:Lipoprotein n=1 Tax=Eubacterium plexicaudatum ASF492 TaxID=1235802 RepID=N2A458_9FIRM|nr:hypothetical protein C823_005074 [Eubacterium plexicaudatum ASF492]